MAAIICIINIFYYKTEEKYSASSTTLYKDVAIRFHYCPLLPLRTEKISQTFLFFPEWQK